jgi:thioredoxin 1
VFKSLFKAQIALGVLLALSLLLAACQDPRKETGEQDEFVKAFGDTRPAPGAVPVLDIDHHKLPVLVIYYADWCPYCKMMLPIIDKMKADFKDQIFFYQVDIDSPAGKAFVNKFRPSRGGIPYFQFFNKYGEFMSEALGSQSEESLALALESLVKF